MKIIIQEEDGSQRAPLILVDLDNGQGFTALNVVLQRLTQEITDLKAALMAPRRSGAQS